MRPEYSIQLGSPMSAELEGRWHGIMRHKMAFFMFNGTLGLNTQVWYGINVRVIVRERVRGGAHGSLVPCHHQRGG